MGLVERAVYEVKDHEDVAKHWGLAREAYLHFTSPIRRYPDLFVHRWLHAIETRGEEAEEELRTQDFLADMNDMANHSSLQANVAEMAERAVGDLKVCQFMAPHEGERHTAQVTRVSPFVSCASSNSRVPSNDAPSTTMISFSKPRAATSTSRTLSRINSIVRASL